MLTISLLTVVCALLAISLVAFNIGREWQRVFGKVKRDDDCPFQGECQACAGRYEPHYHYRITTKVN